MFSQTFTINPVGQGFFYTGDIRTGSGQNTFRFVFDCGSFNKANCLEEVNCFRESGLTDSHELDLLIISHFDADHINHIGKLLEGNIKVKKLVMPFITFEERLFLVLRLLSPFNGQSFTNDDFPVRFIIDPIGTLSGNLGDDSEIFLIEGGPLPLSGMSTKENENSEEISKSLEEEKLSFSFDASEQLESDDITNLIIGSKKVESIFKVKDDRHGRLGYANFYLHIMEFVFYKRSLGDNEIEFYKKVRQKFCEDYSINDCPDQEIFLNKVIEKVKRITSGRLIREIFKESAEGIEIQTRGRAINDLNTTSLCLLHINNKQFIRSLIRRQRRPLDVESNVKFLQKPDGNRATYFTIPAWKYYEPRRGSIFLPNRGIQNRRFPNTLLTSDCFLSEQIEVDDFYNKFSSYWGDFWLLQVPHHGSKRSSGRVLFSKIHLFLNLFINYGVKKEWRGKWRHPSSETIMSLTETGHSSELIPVNEFIGIQCKFEISSF
ncbi:MAG TPA: hypothetical protein VK213_07510 [Bacteroidales bacterium]|nr:hypothetical protein [Bacteroidales bacterium]